MRGLQHGSRGIRVLEQFTGKGNVQTVQGIRCIHDRIQFRQYQGHGCIAADEDRGGGPFRVVLDVGPRMSIRIAHLTIILPEAEVLFEKVTIEIRRWVLCLAGGGQGRQLQRKKRSASS